MRVGGVGGEKHCDVVSNISLTFYLRTRVSRRLGRDSGSEFTFPSLHQFGTVFVVLSWWVSSDGGLSSPSFSPSFPLLFWWMKR